MSSTVFTEKLHAAAFILNEEEMNYSRDVVTIKAGAGVLEPGTVLGEITAEKKFIVSPAASVTGHEGAEVAKAVLVYPVDATAHDVPVTVIVRAASVNKTLLTFDTSVDTAAEIAAKLSQLRDHTIVPR